MELDYFDSGAKDVLTASSNAKTYGIQSSGKFNEKGEWIGPSYFTPISNVPISHNLKNSLKALPYLGRAFSVQLLAVVLWSTDRGKALLAGNDHIIISAGAVND